MEASISEIQAWVERFHKTEDRIADKTKERVTRTIAESIKKTNPILPGRCNLCSKEVTQPVPILMKICVNCCKKFIQRGNKLKVLRKERIDYNCDFCKCRTFVIFHVNPEICIFCSKILGRNQRREE